LSSGATAPSESSIFVLRLQRVPCCHANVFHGDQWHEPGTVERILFIIDSGQGFDCMKSIEWQ